MNGAWISPKITPRRSGIIRKIKAQSLKLKVKTYQSVHNYVDTEEQIPLSLPLPSGPEALLGRRQKGGIPLFGKEGSGEIFGMICLVSYGLLSDYGLEKIDFPLPLRERVRVRGE